MIENSEYFWDELLAFVDARSVIPIIGPELAIVEFEGRREPYQRLLARQLALRLKLDGLPDSPALHEVVTRYLARPGAKRQGIYRELGDLAGKLDVGVPEPFLHLAQIRDLNLFASFCTDDLLARAINQERFAGRPATVERAFTPNEASDLATGDAIAPVVYGLFGRMSVLPKYVVAEEDMIEWITALQVPQKRPEQLFDALGRNHLLLLGCSFPDWLTRFILRTAKNSKLSSERGFSEYFVEASARPDAPLVTFLSSFSRETQVLAEDPAAFVAEFAQRWRARHQQQAADPDPGVAEIPESLEPGSVFISYASEDRPAALRVAATLQAAGLPVWLDRKQLDWGNDYSARIRTAIEQCGLFLPLLSATAEQRTGFYRKEWAWAAERNLEFTGSSVNFLFPLVVDATNAMTSREFPAAFRMRHIEAAPDGQLSTGQVESITAALHSMRTRGVRA